MENAAWMSTSFWNNSEGKCNKNDGNASNLIISFSSNEEIIQLIREGEHDDIGAEKLKGLLKLLPEVDELDMLKSFTGDFNKLGNAEKFLLQLTSLPK